MKKFLSLILLVTLLLCGCSKVSKQFDPQRIIQKNLVYYNHNALTAYKVDNDYLFTISEGGHVQKYVVFSSDRECIECEGIQLIDECDMNQFLGMNFNDVLSMYGPRHVDIGSGFTVPSYVTENAYLIAFHHNTSDDSIGTITKWDLLTNEIVERIDNTTS